MANGSRMSRTSATAATGSQRPGSRLRAGLAVAVSSAALETLKLFFIELNAI